MDGACALRTVGLTRVFDTTRAVDDLTLEVPRGIVFGFLGPNGSGKTTTIRLLLGLLEPTAGSAQVLGFDCRAQADAIRTRCGALLEFPGLYERLTAWDNLQFYARAWALPARERAARGRELLERLGLWERRDDPAGEFSRGMKQKLAIARALVHRPQLVFLDEPTAGLDPVAAAQLTDELAELAAQEGVTVFLTTHDLAQAEKLCQRVAIIRSGKLLAEGTPAELRARAAGPQADIVASGVDARLLAELRAQPNVQDVTQRGERLTITFAGEPRLAPLIALIVNAGGAVEEARKGVGSLEAAFLDLLKEER